MKTLLEFEADWCGPCQQLKPIVSAVMANHEHDVELKTIDVDDAANLDLVTTHGVRAIPTLVLLEGDVVKRVHRGTLGRAELEQFVSSS